MPLGLWLAFRLSLCFWFRALGLAAIPPCPCPFLILFCGHCQSFFCVCDHFFCELELLPCGLSLAAIPLALSPFYRNKLCLSTSFFACDQKNILFYFQHVTAKLTIREAMPCRQSAACLPCALPLPSLRPDCALVGQSAPLPLLYALRPSLRPCGLSVGKPCRQSVVACIIYIGKPAMLCHAMPAPLPLCLSVCGLAFPAAMPSHACKAKSRLALAVLFKQPARQPANSRSSLDSCINSCLCLDSPINY